MTKKSGKIAAVILAAGQGKRMRSELPKVCHPLSGQALINFPVGLCQSLGLAPLIVVVSARRNSRREVQKALHGQARRVRFAIQIKPLGTAHAVASALPLLRKFKGTVLVLNGDAPLLSDVTIKRFLKEHQNSHAALSLISTQLPDPTGYGRIIRNGAGKRPQGIVEERDATASQRAIREVNAGVYAISSAFLSQGLGEITNRNRQGEYYLPDLMAVALRRGLEVRIFAAEDHQEFLGVNSQQELREVERVMKLKQLKVLGENGVQIDDPASTFIGKEVRIASGVVLHPGCTLLGKTTVERGAVIGPYVFIEDTRVGREARIKPFSVLEGARLGRKAVVGPFAHLRPGAELKEGARVGNFVELKKTVLGRGAKANHLAYLGDTTVGRGANIGAGTITCNYDGHAKYPTEIGAEAFIGSDTQLVAPVKVGRGAVIGAGTTLTKDVPAGALALSRVSQINKPGWAKRKRATLSLKAAKRKRT